MKLRKTALIIIMGIIILLLLPAIVLANESGQYKLSKEKAVVESNIYNVPSLGYERMLFVSEYIYIYTVNNQIVKLNQEFEEVAQLDIDYSTKVESADNSIYTISREYERYDTPTNTYQYYLVFNKYNSDFESEVEKKITPEHLSQNTWTYILKYKYHQNNHYILYSGNDSQIYLIILNNNGDIIADTALITDIELDEYNCDFVILNNQLYLKILTYEDGYKTDFYQLKADGTVNLAETIDNYEITQIIQDHNNSFVGIAYSEDDKEYILHLDKEFNVIQQVNYAESIDDSSIELNTEKLYRTKVNYLVLGRTINDYQQDIPVILVYDNKFKYQYKIEYNSDLVEVNGNGKIDVYIDDNDMYVASTIGYKGYTPEGGSLIVKYVLDSYSVNTEIIEGQGSIVSNIQNAVPGEEVTLTINPNKGYEVKKIQVLTISGEEIQVNNNSFIMPAENVIIKVEFKEKASIINPNTSSGVSVMIIVGFAIGVIILIQSYRKYIRLNG